MDDLGLQVRNRFDTKMLWGACWGFIPNKGKSKHKLSHGRYAKSICRTFLGRFFWHPEGFPTLPARFVQTEHRFCVRCWVPHFKSLRDDFLKTVHLPKWYLRQTEILACAQKQLTSITCRWRGGYTIWLCLKTIEKYSTSEIERPKLASWLIPHIWASRYTTSKQPD
jgi:hypothetical protein